MPINVFDRLIKRRPQWTGYPDWVAYEPALLPPPELMGTEGITVLEEWLRWGEEWSVLLRVYGHLQSDARVMEIGCGLGRIAFPLRYVLSNHGRYTGFEIVGAKVDFLQKNFSSAHPNFSFVWADVHNTYYNPPGKLRSVSYRFPADDDSQDLVFAASVFTHMTPENTGRYFSEAARVLRTGGRCLFSFFLLDYYAPGRARPHGFARPDFDFDHEHEEYGSDFAVVVPDNPEQMTAYRLEFLSRMAESAGLRLEGLPIPGLWSGSYERWVGAQDLIVLVKE